MSLTDEMVGHVMSSVSVENDDEEVFFRSVDGTIFRFFHSQNCCETVIVDDIVGDLSDLVGNPILKAEESINDNEGVEPEEYDSHTWTFYHFSTIKGTVTIKWHGSSNGYYSETVNLEKIMPGGAVCDG